MSRDKIDVMTLQNKTLAIITGGGAGTRLFPLTQKRAKPAVPLGGKYRLVDLPISNCLNSGFRQVYVVTQFHSEPLHRHIAASYKSDNFTKSFIEILVFSRQVLIDMLANDHDDFGKHII
jgi:glucose-1-phosphate adenylyltransferase